MLYCIPLCAMKLDVPFFHQDTDYTCGPTSLQMLLAFFHIRKSEGTLTQQLAVDPSPVVASTTHGHLVSLAREYGFFVYANADATLDELLSFVHKGSPVLIDYDEPSSNEGHYAVVVGTEEGKIILNDPWNGKNFRLTKKSFLNRWHDESTHSRRWLLVLSHEDFHLGREFTPTSDA